MKIMRDIIQINEELCNGCGQCILDCAEGAIRIDNGKAKVISDMLCDGLGACLGGCPTGALTIEKREAEAYNEEEVEARLAKQGKKLPHTNTHSCPGSAALSFDKKLHEKEEKKLLPLIKPKHADNSVAFSNEHWPLKLRLLSPQASFLQNAEILLAADCAAFASADFHNHLRAGKVIVTACPKFEGIETIKEKLTEIAEKARAKSITIARIEVPCCTGLLSACSELAEILPIEDYVISRQGSLLSHKRYK